jgi:hypothetical protein
MTRGKEGVQGECKNVYSRLEVGTPIMLSRTINKINLIEGSLGANKVKGTMATKVKVLFQQLYMTCDIYVLVYNLIFCIIRTQFTIVCYI